MNRVWYNSRISYNFKLCYGTHALFLRSKNRQVAKFEGSPTTRETANKVCSFEYIMVGVYIRCRGGGMVDTQVSKTCAHKGMRVRLSPAAPLPLRIGEFVGCRHPIYTSQRRIDFILYRSYTIVFQIDMQQ